MSSRHATQCNEQQLPDRLTANVSNDERRRCLNDAGDEYLICTRCRIELYPRDYWPRLRRR